MMTYDEFLEKAIKLDKCRNLQTWIDLNRELCEVVDEIVKVRHLIDNSLFTGNIDSWYRDGKTCEVHVHKDESGEYVSADYVYEKHYVTTIYLKPEWFREYSKEEIDKTVSEISRVNEEIARKQKELDDLIAYRTELFGR